MVTAGLRDERRFGRGLVGLDLFRARSLQHVAGFRYFGGGSMCDQNELAGLDRRFVFHDAVLWDTDAVESCTKRTETPYDDSTFERRNDPGNNRARSNNGTDTRDNKESRADEQAPKAAPKCAPLAPIFHSVTCVIETNDVGLGLIIAADDGQFLDIKPATLQFFNRIFGCGVLAENCDNRVLVLSWHGTHGSSPLLLQIDFCTAIRFVSVRVPALAIIRV